MGPRLPAPKTALTLSPGLLAPSLSTLTRDDQLNPRGAKYLREREREGTLSLRVEVGCTQPRTTCRLVFSHSPCPSHLHPPTVALPPPFSHAQHSQQLYRHIYLSCKEESNIQKHYEALYGLLALISIELANEEVVVDLIRLVLAVQVGLFRGDLAWAACGGVGSAQGTGWASTHESMAVSEPGNTALLAPHSSRDHKPWFCLGNHPKRPHPWLAPILRPEETQGTGSFKNTLWSLVFQVSQGLNETLRGTKFPSTLSDPNTNFICGSSGVQAWLCLRITPSTYEKYIFPVLAPCVGSWRFSKPPSRLLESQCSLDRAAAFQSPSGWRCTIKDARNWGGSFRPQKMGQCPGS